MITYKVLINDSWVPVTVEDMDWIEEMDWIKDQFDSKFNWNADIPY